MRDDEIYIIGLCDAVLGLRALRQHRFDFLRGDPGKNGRRVRLPVDAYYPELQLVIEYRERQHVEPVRFFDRRQTISGCARGEQRRRYDERRRAILPANSIELVELDCTMFACDSSKRLRKDTAADAKVIATKLERAVAVGHGRI